MTSPDDVLITDGMWKGYYRPKNMNLNEFCVDGVMPDMASIGYSPSYVYGTSRNTIQRLTGFSIALVKEKFKAKEIESPEVCHDECDHEIWALRDRIKDKDKEIASLKAKIERLKEGLKEGDKR